MSMLLMCPLDNQLQAQPTHASCTERSEKQAALCKDKAVSPRVQQPRLLQHKQQAWHTEHAMHRDGRLDAGEIVLGWVK